MRNPLERIAADDRPVMLVLGLTLATGAVDAVSYLSLDHVFTANMSGNMALLGIDAANGRFPLGYLVSLAGFTLGAAAAWRWMRAARGSALELLVRGLYAQIAIMAALAFVLGVADVSDDSALRMAVTFALAAAMGLQTALARNVGVEDVNTTVATMTLHAYAADSRFAGGDARRWRRRVGVVAALFAGAALAVLAERVMPWGGMAVAVTIVAAVVLGAHATLRCREPDRSATTDRPTTEGSLQ
ncbi:YoaK family protein [Conexibacter stalactiti]|uniref:YoaK family protein n=1 Tax=Conexibacter stalactiti TaxID=1940611 RepID=A0ABU4HUR6_9ACTN|nr:YoaK family protein [Conexibacter stalactiti]MDW5597062.1 YoaK family protein [Conexibacter stalactiti]MEC5037704.1 YoaK family protein [Conexibacter stalactiti]